MTPVLLIQKELQDAKDATKDQLVKISKTVMQVCCFGGNNYVKRNELTTTFNNLMTAVFKLKGILENANNTQLPKKVREQLKQASAQFENSDSFFGIQKNDWSKYFQTSKYIQTSYEQGICINPAVLPIILRYMAQVISKIDDPQKLPFYTDFQKLKTYELSDFQSFVSFLAYIWIIKIKSPEVRIKGKEEEIKIGTYYSLEQKIEPTNQNHRKLLLQYMVSDLTFGSFYFGMGNCQLMAELAFLVGIQMLSATPIRYVQFQSTTKVYEELNAIVVGNWPNPGCFVLAPWYREASFEWKGTFATTPEIKHHDKTSIFFTVKDKQEQTELQQLLAQSNFDLEKLLKSGNRATYSKYIKEKSEVLFDISCGNLESNLNSKP